MATKRTTAVRKVLKIASQDASYLPSGNEDSCGNNSGAKRKTKPSGTIVKSRYMQSEKKSIVRKNSPNESVLVPPRHASHKRGSGHKSRFGTPPRQTLHFQSEQNSVCRNGTVNGITNIIELQISICKSFEVKLPPAVIPSLLESSSVCGNVLQSTVLDGYSMRPDFDVSVIKENAATASLPNALDPNDKNRNLGLETFLLAFLTAKIENSTQKLKDEAERNLMTLLDEEEKLRSKIINKKQQYLQLEKQQQLSDLLDLQIVALTPVTETAKQFTEEYKTFASAIDTTRHELPVKTVHIELDREKFLEKAVVCLNQSQCILEEYMKDVSKESKSTVACLKDMKSAAHQIHLHLLSASSDLLELSSLVSQETLLVQHCLEEDKIGFDNLQSLISD